MVFVKELLKEKNVDEIWLIARRKEVLEELAASCNHNCRILAYDLCSKQAQEDIKELLNKEQPRITLLVNSAGYGILGEFYQETKMTTDCEGDLEKSNWEWMQEQTGMISLNCEALTAMTYLCIPYM